MDKSDEESWRQGKPKREMTRREQNFNNKMEERRQRSIASTDQIRSEREINWMLMSPLLIAPTLPLIRIAFRRNPKMGDKVFKAAIGGALVASGLGSASS